MDRQVHPIEQVAEQSLAIVADIADKARQNLEQAGYSIEITTANSITDNARLNAQNIAQANERDHRILLSQPAFMRVDLEDEDGSYCRSLYITSVATPTGLSHWSRQGIDFVSYRAALGRIAALPCGADCEIKDQEYYIARKVKFAPQQLDNLWDCRQVDILVGKEKNFVESFRALLEALQDNGIDVDAYFEELKQQEQTLEGKLKNLVRGIRSGMSLRNQAVLDQYQDDIFRLPVNSQRIILGPPGTGKTTTLIKRLGQKLDSDTKAFSEPELQLLRKLGKDGKSFGDWIMFTPSELLKTYLLKAFNQEGISVRDNLQTWDYAKTIARQSLDILMTANSNSGYRLDNNQEFVQREIIDDPRMWYASVSSYFERILNIELANGLKMIVLATTTPDAPLIAKLKAIVESNNSIARKYEQLFELENQIKQVIKTEKESSDQIIREERNLLFNRDQQVFEQMARFLSTMGKEADDDEDDESDYDEDEAEQEQKVSYDQKNKAVEAYLRFLRRAARLAYQKKSLPKNSKDAKLKQWLGDRLPEQERFIALGRSISLQNGLRRNLNCWKRLYKKQPVSAYRKFRKEDSYQHFYCQTPDSKKISQAELDLLLLVSLRNIQQLLKQPYIIRNIDEVHFQELKGLRDGLLKDQVMVDEATDFSVLQLACMQAMTNPLLTSFFACGDFNQRLTNQGIKDIELLDWINPGIKAERINAIYRQSPLLNQFTHAVLDLMDQRDLDAKSELSSDDAFAGLMPVLAEYVADTDQIAEWVSQRIAEIEQLVNGHHDGNRIFPSMVVLVKSEADVLPMAKALDEYLYEFNLKADACLGGKSMGNASDVRVCSIEFIKGLEFEAVFFIGIDELLQAYPELYQKFLYVGATRAATYLGMTCTDELPEQLESLRPHFAEGWNIADL